MMTRWSLFLFTLKLFQNSKVNQYNPPYYRLKKKITLSYAEKVFYKIQYPCMIEPLRKVGIGELPQYDKGHLQKKKKKKQKNLQLILHLKVKN